MGKVYLVTGGGGGIGSAIVETIASNIQSGIIIVHYNSSKEPAEKLQKKLQTKHVIIEIIQANLENKTDIEKMLDAILSRYKKVDVLINNAGYVEDMDFTNRKYEDFEKTFKINLYAPFLISQRLGRTMVENKYGRIINVSSTNGLNTIYPTSIDYDASKAALNSLTRNLAIEFAPYVNVNAILPGWVGTEMNKQLDTEFLESEKRNILLERFAEPREIADLVLFLASDKANYITAALIPIDGGIKIK